MTVAVNAAPLGFTFSNLASSAWYLTIWHLLLRNAKWDGRLMNLVDQDLDAVSTWFWNPDHVERNYDRE
ncbi:MAG: hypothetical protein M3N95_04330 [Actinomycetota bacterium]|nr:hypothetical protein [Actinomycetota bacterium]